MFSTVCVCGHARTHIYMGVCEMVSIAVMIDGLLSFFQMLPLSSSFTARPLILFPLCHSLTENTPKPPCTHTHTHTHTHWFCFQSVSHADTHWDMKAVCDSASNSTLSSHTHSHTLYVAQCYFVFPNWPSSLEVNSLFQAVLSLLLSGIQIYKDYFWNAVCRPFHKRA